MGPPSTVTASDFTALRGTTEAERRGLAEGEDVERFGVKLPSFVGKNDHIIEFFEGMERLTFWVEICDFKKTDINFHQTWKSNYSFGFH